MALLTSGHKTKFAIINNGFTSPYDSLENSVPFIFYSFLEDKFILDSLVMFQVNCLTKIFDQVHHFTLALFLVSCCLCDLS